MSKCRYDRDDEAYLVDGEPCKVDEYGDPTKHCTARRNCAQHIGRDELTCPRCIGRTRGDLRQVVALSALMMPAAVAGGVNSEAANLAGPAADPRAIAEKREYVRHHVQYRLMTDDPARQITDEQAMRVLAALPGDDERHPYSVLVRWQLAFSEDYGHPLPDRFTIAGAGAYIERHLHRIAQDPEQEFSLIAREIRKVRSHLESVLHNSSRKDRGAPCPECTSEASGVGPRLVREYGHWCEDPDCERLHYDDDSADEWVCPRNRHEHRWEHEVYERWIEERRAVG